MAYNKFIKADGTVLLDLTDTSVSAATLVEGVTALDKSGNKITGALVVPEEPVLQEKTVTPTEAVQEITADEGNDGLSKVTVEAIPSEYVIPSGTLSITENGTHDVTNYASAEVNVPSEEPNLISKTITENGTYKASEEVADALAGTWVFNSSVVQMSGSVGDHSMIYSDTAYTNPVGCFRYATSGDGSTFNEYTFDCSYFDSTLNCYVGVSTNYRLANIIYSFNIGFDSTQDEFRYNSFVTYDDLGLNTLELYDTINDVTVNPGFVTWLQANATKQGATAIDGYSEVIVNVEPTLEEITITENGEYTPSGDGFSKVTVEVEGGGTDSAIPTEVSTAAEMTALLESGEVGGVYKYVGTTTETYENGALYVLENLYITFSSPQGFTLNIVDNTKYWDGTLECSTDTTNWNEWDGTTTLSADDGKLYMRGTGNTYITGSSASSSKACWELTGSEISCTGNIENLLDYTTVANGEHPAMADHCYESMFCNCTSLTTAPALPATTLSSNCYEYMFLGCTGLTSAPALPATNLADNCYSGMFYGCTGFTSAPKLPATILAVLCYENMFGDCTGLTSAPELPATILAMHCYNSMFYGCTNLTTAPELPATVLVDYCYYGMFRKCTGLIIAPELPITTVVYGCYGSMFEDCTGLITAPELPATTLDHHCYEGMFKGCTGLTSAPELPATDLASNCYASMFSGCTNLTTAPELPATTLTSNCYSGMFSRCTSLTTAPELPATDLHIYCYYLMFYGCTGLTTAPELPATTLVRQCYYRMFEGCTSIKLSAEQTDEYTIAYRIPASGEGTIPEAATDALTDMFISTGGTFTGTPEINTTYYLHSSNGVA